MAKLLDPFGNTIRDPARVMVFVEERDGRMHGWEVTGATGTLSASWKITGHPGGSAHGEIRASGEFRRIAKDQQSIAIERTKTDPPEIPGQMALPSGLDDDIVDAEVVE